MLKVAFVGVVAITFCLVATDARATFFGVDGESSPIEGCTDGDASCDADAEANGVCVFQLTACFDALTEYAVSTPRLKGARPEDRQNARALLDSVLALGGELHANRHGVIQFDPPLDGTKCTETISIQVPLKETRSGFHVRRYNLRTRALYATRVPSKDSLTLTCNPQD